MPEQLNSHHPIAYPIVLLSVWYFFCGVIEIEFCSACKEKCKSASLIFNPLVFRACHYKLFAIL
jgi:hypothetical protein